MLLPINGFKFQSTAYLLVIQIWIYLYILTWQKNSWVHTFKRGSSLVWNRYSLFIFKPINQPIGPYIENLVKSWLECMKNMQAIFNGYWTRFFPLLDFWQRHHPSVAYSNRPNKRKTKSIVLSTKLSFQYWQNTPKPLLKIGSVNKADLFWYWSHTPAYRGWSIQK